MVRIIHQSHGYAAFEQAFKKAHLLKRDVLFSMVSVIDPVDPLQFYEAGYELFRGERTFWQDREGQLVLVGAGNAYTIYTNNHQRFDAVQEEWTRFIDESINIGQKAYGTGPLLLGGFSFDPKQEAELEWSNFGHAHFQLPTFLVSINENATYLTTCVVCSEHDQPHVVWERLQEQREALLEKAQEPYSDVSVISTTEVEPDRWKEMVGRVVGRLQQEEMEKVVLARKIKVEFDGKKRSDLVLEKLRDAQKDSFLFSLEVMDSCFVGATPERLVKKKGRHILSTCLAGSISRGATVEEDEQFGRELLNDPKNLREHQIVVEMIENHLRDLCEEVNVPDRPDLMKIRDIQHLYTPVEGVASSGMTVVDFVKQLHPTPALGGTPTEEAMAVIREEEEMNRGLYAAPVGWMDAEGNGEFAVAIRSGLLHDRFAYLYAGCGVVADSEPESEYQETLIKFRPMLRAVGGTMK